jgi:hypothetical protein
LYLNLPNLVCTLMLSPTYRPCPRLRAVIYPLLLSSHCGHRNSYSDDTAVMFGPRKKGATEGRGSKSRDFPILFLSLYSPLSPLTYVSEVAGDGYHVAFATNICVNRTARQLVWKKVNGGCVTAVSRRGVG